MSHTEFKIIDPYTQRTLSTYPISTYSDLINHARNLNTVFNTWSKQPMNQRVSILSQLRAHMLKHETEIATYISTDMGKPITEAMGEVKKSMEAIEYYETQADTIAAAMQLPYGHREPLGVILGIMPWNFPLWQQIRFMIPTLLAGNVCLIKPAYNTYRTAEWLQTCINNITDTPPIATCMASNADTQRCIASDYIAGVSLTGSVRAGKQVGATAGTHIKPCVLELGGSDPYIICDDADIDTATSEAIKARFLNAGQTCISAKRFLIQDTCYEEVLGQLVTKASDFLHCGDPLDPKTTIGPLARPDIKTTLDDQLARANVPENAILYKGPENADVKNYMRPLIIDGQGLPKDSPLLTEEVFGPIAVCMPFSTISDAITMANATPFGLGASVWSTSTDTLKKCKETIMCGTLAMNNMVRSQVNIPFGGRKQSGLGIELGIDGALSFTAQKVILQN